MDMSISKPAIIFRIGKPTGLFSFRRLSAAVIGRRIHVRFNRAETDFSDHLKSDVGLRCEPKTHPTQYWEI